MNNLGQYGHYFGGGQSSSTVYHTSSLGFEVSLLAIETMPAHELYEVMFCIINRLEVLDAQPNITLPSKADTPSPNMSCSTNSPD